MPEHGTNMAHEAEAVVSQMIRARRARAALFRPELFSDPAWDMLLTLFLARTRGQATTETELAEASGTSMPTAARWIAALERDGLLRRSVRSASLDPGYVELSDRAAEAIYSWVDSFNLPSIIHAGE